MTALQTYNKKRDFKRSPEPKGVNSKKTEHRFVVQKHDASHLHYDFRLELDGVLKSWAVPKGPSLDPSVKRLAVHVEDHPVSYIHFEGTIPKGNYGAGTVEVWDKGTFTAVDKAGKKMTESQALTALEKGELKFELKGGKLNGGFVLVQLKNGNDKNWLLIKHRDEYASADDSEEKPKEKPAKKVSGKKKDITDTSQRNEKNKSLTINGHKLALTNLNKVYWPDEGITKGDMINYYEAVSPFILPYLKDRPMSLKRNPNGIADEGFFHKDAGDQAPGWMDKINIHSESANKTVHYLLCNNKAALLYIANLGCIELNPWNSTTKAKEKPTYLVMDIDPSDKNTFNEVIETANVIKSILDKAGAACYCKTSGATGLHVYVPMENKYDYEHVKEFAHLIAVLTQEQLPKTTSVERSLSKRGPKIYVDYLQNRIGQTLATAYSLRPREGATASAPLEWKEVKRGLEPGDFTIHNMIDRIKKKGDLFAPVLKKGIDLKKCLKNLEA